MAGHRTLILRCPRGARASKDASIRATGMGAFVYMLQCADGSYYVGSARADGLEKRVAEHEAGHYGGYTSSRRPVRLVWSENFDRITDAIAAERQIKGWGRAKKGALIGGNWAEIRRLAARRAGKKTPAPNDETQHKRRNMPSYNASASSFEARPLRGRAPQDEEK